MITKRHIHIYNIVKKKIILDGDISTIKSLKDNRVSI